MATPTTMITNIVFEPKTSDLSAITAINNNPNFAFRIVAEETAR